MRRRRGLKGKFFFSSLVPTPLCSTDDPQQALAALMNDVLLQVFMQLPFNPLLIAAADQMKKLSTFYNTMPRLEHKLMVKNPKTEVESEVTLKGLASFFG